MAQQVIARKAVLGISKELKVFFYDINFTIFYKFYFRFINLRNIVIGKRIGQCFCRILRDAIYKLNILKFVYVCKMWAQTYHIHFDIEKFSLLSFFPKIKSG